MSNILNTPQEELYVDQLFDLVKAGDKTIDLVYTVVGLKKMEEELLEKIYNVKTEAELDNLKIEISTNPHLHEALKDDLTYNIVLEKFFNKA